MALFKIFRGPENELNSVPLHEGYAYFCEDSGNLYVDISNEAGGRVHVSADAAERLVKRDATGTILNEIDIDDVVLKIAIIDIAHGGTNATTAAGARTNLSVYSKAETDDAIDEVTSVSYSTTLTAANWVASGDAYVYTYSNSNLSCGKNHDVPPIITYTSNQEEYSKIDSAEATHGQGIVFTSSKAIESDIGIIIIDNK